MDTAAVQRALVALGYPLPKFGADGSFGGESRAAMNNFQRDNDLPVTASPDRRTIEALQAALAAKVPCIFTLPPTKRRVDEIIVHGTATPEGRDVSVATIRGWHKAQGWKDIGYHWVVLLDGTVKPGRPEAEIGSHVAGHNTGTLGVVYVGGVSADGKTAKDNPHARAARRLVRARQGADRPLSDRQEGHRTQPVCQQGLPQLRRPQGRARPPDLTPQRPGLPPSSSLPWRST